MNTKQKGTRMPFTCTQQATTLLITEPPEAEHQEIFLMCKHHAIQFTQVEDPYSRVLGKTALPEGERLNCMWWPAMVRLEAIRAAEEAEG